MQVSTKLFNQQQIRQFSKLTADIQEKQEKISSGRAILNASDDPVAAVNLSAANEQKILLERFEENVYLAQNRLEAGDKVLQESISVMTRITELATQARNPTYDAFSRRAILTEITELREVLVDLANTQDARGQSLFAGFSNEKIAFVEGPDGKIHYNGDRGTHTVQISESMNIPTSLDGITVFGRVETANGRRDIFEIVDSVAASINPLRDLDERASASAKASVSFTIPRQNQKWELDLAGSLGQVRISAVLSEGNEQKFADAVNAQSDLTGVVASFDQLTGRTILTDIEAGEIEIENLEIEGQELSNYAGQYHLIFNSVDENQQEVGEPRVLSDLDQLLGRGISNLKSAMDHLSIQQAVFGAQMSKAEVQRGALATRKLAVTQDISKLGDADLAKLVTDLQAQLTNRDAAQQAFAKMGQQSLFDYLR
ncbi:MAG: flagellar hook-associated protein FlgL [Burkholderiaceae bacterium]